MLSRPLLDITQKRVTADYDPDRMEAIKFYFVGFPDPDS